MAKQDTNNLALKALANVPKIGSAFGYDLALGFSHEKAIKIASDTLYGVPEGSKIEIIKSLLIIFDNWSDEHGVYPPNTGGFLSGMLGDVTPKQEPAIEYRKRILLSVGLDGEKQHIPDPWECCPYVTTPLGLFWKLTGDKFKPLMDFMSVNWLKFDKIIAILILISNKPDSNWQSGDCISAALQLAAYRLEIQKDLLETYEPDAMAALKRRAQKKIADEAQRQRTEQIILEEYQKQMDKNKTRPLNKNLAKDLGVSEATLSRVLRRKGHERYKKRK